MLLLIASSTIAMMFLLSGVAKLSRPKEFRANLLLFGVPTVAASLLAVGLPSVEVLAGGAILFPGAAQFGTMTAVGLLILFTASIAYQLLRGRKPDCQCFGQMRARPISYWTLLRNVLILGLALYVATSQQEYWTSVAGWLRQINYLGFAFSVALAALFAVATVEGLVIAQLVRSYGQVLLRLEVIENSRHPYHNELASPPDNLGKESVTLETLRAQGKLVAIFFLEPTCGPCTALYTDLVRWAAESVNDMRIAVVSAAPGSSLPAELRDASNVYLLNDPHRVTSRRYGVGGTPSAIIVRPDNSPASGLLAGPDQIRRFFSTFDRETNHRDSEQIGRERSLLAAGTQAAR